MRWSKNHKEATHQKIVETAAAAFRKQGIDGIGLTDIMKRVGLTHGGFYAHFQSKEELIAEALAKASEQTREWLSRAVDGTLKEKKLTAVVEAYLSPLHCKHPEEGCPVATLGGELTRHRGKHRRAFDASIRSQLEWLKSCSAAVDRETRELEATVAYAAMVGGIILARGLEDSQEADRLLKNLRKFLHDAFADSETPPLPPERPSAARKRSAAKAPKVGSLAHLKRHF